MPLTATALLLAASLSQAPAAPAPESSAESAPSSSSAHALSPSAGSAPSSPAESPHSGRSAGFGFDRVDLLSEDPGTFLHYDAPMAGQNLQAFGMRFIEQVKVVARLPLPSLSAGGRWYAGASVQSQSLSYEHPLLKDSGLYATGALQTRLLLPRGVTAGLAFRTGVLRVGVSVSAFSQASWARPNWQQWSVLPTLGVGLGAPVR